MNTNSKVQLTQKAIKTKQRLYNYVTLDVETTGQDHTTNDILSLYMAPVDFDGSSYKINSDLGCNLNLQPQPTTEIEPAALECNGIVLEEHNKTAVTQLSGRDILRDYILNLRQHLGMEPSEKFVVVGWGTGFDTDYVSDLVGFGFFSENFHYSLFDVRTLSMVVIGDFMEIDASAALELQENVGLDPYSSKPMSLVQVATMLGINTVGAHTPEQDCIMTIDVLNALTNTISSN